MENGHSFDPDVVITHILLAHHCVFEPHYGYNNFRRGRNMYGFVCVYNGQAEYVFENGQRLILNPGEIAFIPSQSAYRVQAYEDNIFDHYTVNFLGEIDSFPDWITQDSFLVLKSRNFEYYLTQFREMAELWASMHSGYRMLTKAKLSMMMTNFLLEAMNCATDPASYNRTLPAVRLMENHYEERISISSLAQACHMSTSSFRRAFTNVYNQSPIAYLMNLRIEKAKGLLLVGYSIEDIAHMTGFDDVNYFGRCFRKYTGITPGKYRNQY